MSTPSIFYCFKDKHMIEDAVIMSCCCKVIGCRSHIFEAIQEKDQRCPSCNKEVMINTIVSLPSLNESITAFLPEQQKVNEIMDFIDKNGLNQSSTEPEAPREKDRSRSRQRSRSRHRSRSHHSKERHRSRSHHRHSRSHRH